MWSSAFFSHVFQQTLCLSGICCFRLCTWSSAWICLIGRWPVRRQSCGFSGTADRRQQPQPPARMSPASWSPAISRPSSSLSNYWRLGPTPRKPLCCPLPSTLGQWRWWRSSCSWAWTSTCWMITSARPWAAPAPRPTCPPLSCSCCWSTGLTSTKEGAGASTSPWSLPTSTTPWTRFACCCRTAPASRRRRCRSWCRWASPSPSWKTRRWSAPPVRSCCHGACCWRRGPSRWCRELCPPRCTSCPCAAATTRSPPGYRRCSTLCSRWGTCVALWCGPACPPASTTAWSSCLCRGPSRTSACSESLSLTETVQIC